MLRKTMILCSVWVALCNPYAKAQTNSQIGDCVSFVGPEETAPEATEEDLTDTDPLAIRPWIFENGTWKKSDVPLFEVSFLSGANLVKEGQHQFKVRNVGSPLVAKESDYLGMPATTAWRGGIELNVKPFYLFPSWKASLGTRVDLEDDAENDGRLLIESNMYVRLRNKLWKEGNKTKNYIRFEVYLNDRRAAGDGESSVVALAKRDFQREGRSAKTTTSFGAGFCRSNANANLAAVFDILPAVLQPKGKITGLATTFDVKSESDKVIFASGLGFLFSLKNDHYVAYELSHQTTRWWGQNYNVVSRETDVGIVHAKFGWKDFLPKSPIDLSATVVAGTMFPLNGFGYNRDLARTVGGGVYFRVDKDFNPIGNENFTSMEVKLTIPLAR